MRVSGLVVLFAFSCSHERSETRPTSAPVTPAISVVRAHGALANRAGSGGSLARDEHGHRLKTTSGFRTTSIDGVLPLRADGPLRVSLPGRPAAFVELVAEGAREVSSEVVDRAVVHAQAFPATDLVHVADGGRIEELRVLRGPAAPRVASWKLSHGPEIASLRVASDRVEAIDATGRVILQTEPIVAIDANDVMRTPAIHLEGDRLTVTLDTEGLAYPIVLDPSWIPVATEAGVARLAPYMYTLSDGRVLVMGGNVGTTNVDIYDPNTESWVPDSAPRHLLTARDRNGAFTVLPGGKILVSGGTSGSSAELYDPATLTSAATGSMKTSARYGVAAQVISGGRVGVFGGGGQVGAGTFYSTIETYDIATGAWTLQPTSLPAPRGYAASMVLTTGPHAGKVWLVGGQLPSTWLSTSEVIDPVTFASTPLGSMSTARSRPSITMLTSGSYAGKILVAGGWPGPGPGVSTSELFDPVTGTFSPGPAMSQRHYAAASVTLSDGRWVVLGGVDTGVGGSTVEIFDPSTSTWGTLKPMVSGHQDPSTIEIIGRRILVVGNPPTSKSEVYWPDPVTCSTGASCPSGFCVDGYCCDTACTGQCQACDALGRGGICSPVDASPPHGTRPSCGTYNLCSAGACATTCGADGACASGNFCDLTTSKCLAKKPTGSGCTTASQCTSGFCADGYCCSAACTGSCSACDVTGSEGTCTAVLGTPHGARSCPSPFACSASGACATSCAVDTDCASTHYCTAPTCTLRLGNGVACTSGAQCQSGNCVDGYCCNTSCTSPCMACNVGGKLGTCSNVDSGAPHGARSCAPYLECKTGACATGCATAAECTTGSYCSGAKCIGGKANGSTCGTGAECTSGFCADGVCCNSACTADCGSCALAGLEGTCSPRPTAATCGTSGCSGAKQVAVGHCSGTTIACVPGVATPCPGSLVCADATNCKTSCAADADCTTGACDTASGTCTAPDGGTIDTGVADTGSDAAGDGSVGSDAIAMEPAPKVAEHPSVDGFVRCNKASECTSGFCVEGVCCDSACTDRCHSCALLSSPGKCTIEPIGVDLRSECGPANTCLGTCDGKGECIGAGNGTMCARNRCKTSSTGVGPAYCAAPGAKCPTDDTVPFDCAPYACEPAFGACLTQCKSSADCANGAVCDVGSGQCVAPPPAEDSGGCAFGAPSPNKGLALLAGLVLASLARARRRAARR